MLSIFLSQKSQLNELWDVLWMVAEVRVQDDNVGSFGRFEALHVGGSKTKLSTSLDQLDFARMELHQLFASLGSIIWGFIVDYDDLNVELAG